MFQTSVRLFINELRISLRWWKILIFIIISVGLVVFNSERSDNVFLSIYWSIYLSGMICTAVLPKYRKVDFLLPQDEKSRLSYILSSALVVLLFMILWYAIVYIINVIMGNYSVGRAITKLLCEEVLLLIVICSSSLGYRYSPDPMITVDGMTVKKKMTKEEKKRTFYVIILMIYPTLHIAILVQLLSGIWYFISTLIAYPTTIAVAYFILADMRKVKISYETIRKPVKIF